MTKATETKIDAENIVAEVIEQTAPPKIIKGEKGEKGKDGKNGINGKDGKDGRDGIDGLDGLDGKDGKDGYIVSAYGGLYKMMANRLVAAQSGANIAFDTVGAADGVEVNQTSGQIKVKTAGVYCIDATINLQLTHNAPCGVLTGVYVNNEPERTSLMQYECMSRGSDGYSGSVCLTRRFFRRLSEGDALILRVMGTSDNACRVTYSQASLTVMLISM